MPPPLRWISSRFVYRSRWMFVRADVVEDLSGAQAEYGVVERHDFVLVIPVRESEILVVKQYRYPIGAWTLEFPQGALEPNEKPFDAAHRELREETGAEAAEIKRVGR